MELFGNNFLPYTSVFVEVGRRGGFKPLANLFVWGVVNKYSTQFTTKNERKPLLIVSWFVFSCRHVTFAGDLNISYFHFGFIYVVRLIDFVWITLRCVFLNCSPIFFFFFWRDSPPQWGRASSFTRLLDHTQRRTAVDRTSLEEWSARRRDLYLTTLNSRRTSMPPVGFEPTILACERRRPTP